MAAYGELASLLNNIELMMAHRRFSTSVEKNQIQSLHGKADELLKFIMTNNYGVGSKEADDLERKIASAARWAEDVIESHIVDQIHAEIASAAGVAEDVIESHIVDQIHAGSNRASHGFLFNLRQMIKACLGSNNASLESNNASLGSNNASLESNNASLGSNNATASLGWAWDLQQIIDDMDAIMKKAAEVGEKWRLREKQPTHDMEALKEKAAEKQPLTTIGEISAVGIEGDVLKLLDELCLDQPKRHIISIVGMGGSGKTTLAQNVYNHLLIKETFHIRVWATLSQQYSVQEILSQLLSCLGKKSDDDDLGKELYQTLIGRKYLIVLDDIWSVEPWNEVRQFFPDTGNGSRVVLTTRLLDVARDCLSNFCFPVNLLDEDRSWKLLCKKAFQDENCPYPELEKVGKKIARLCKGLPLSIVVIGGLLLNSPRIARFWEDFARNIKSLPNAKEKEVSLDILSLSYKHLPPHLKPCFLYMGVFKEDSMISVSKIVKLWVSEGFVRPKGTKVLEEIAEDYLKDLISRNLVLVDKFRKNGRIRSFRIHDLLRDLCLNLAQQQDFFHVMNPRNRGIKRRLVYEGLQWEIGAPLLRSIMASGDYMGHIKCKLLRVLDESPYTRQSWELAEFGKNVFGNVNLRYLAYTQPFTTQSVWELPTSLLLIWNLQTLISTKGRTNLVVVAPIEIWKMRQLRHVVSPGIYVPPFDEQDYMKNLQTLTGAINFRLSEQVCKIIPKIKKLGLIYDIHLKGYNDSLIERLCYLDRFNRLESLKMEIRSSWWLTIRDPELINKLAFPSSLNKLSLQYCQLHWDDLTVIGSLPHLQVLNLGFSAVWGEKWSPVPGQFPKLKFLKIDSCRLFSWDADKSHFPVLEKLVLYNLNSFEKIPSGIGDIPTLELIRVDRCDNLSVAISAMKIKEDQLDQGIDALQVQVKVIRSKEDEFRKMVKTEELKINDIQFEVGDY